ncbi:MAG: Lanthionine biosynthesis protein LanM [Spartobacteria bacterium]|nr:Lanthionine biosynthesis protein LanM [Spartobacteria bacterium]
MVRAAADLDDGPRRTGRIAAARNVRTSRGVCESLLRRERGQLPPWASELRRMLDALSEPIGTSPRTAPLDNLCEIGSEYGLKMLERTASAELLSLMRLKAKSSLKSDLQRILTRVTRPSFELEFNAFRCAFEAIYSGKATLTSELIERKFLGERPYNRLVSLFKKFPVLAKLWSQLICQWVDQIAELLLRFSADRAALSRAFFGGQSIGPIFDFRAGLSDPHNEGRSVMLLRLKACSIVYKPRSGHGEQEWFNFVRHLNAGSLQPELRAAKVLCRGGHCWMEQIRFAPCKNHAAARRFYEHLGETIAAAYFLRAVDCHRDNLIASGEHPVLIDAETLWHVSPGQEKRAPLDILYQTGFFPCSTLRSSWQYRSSLLGKATSGQHIPRIGAQSLNAERYERDIAAGFRKVWRYVFKPGEQPVEFSRSVRRLRRRQARRIFWPTANYDHIRRASIQPSVLGSGIKREILIARLCRRNGVSSAVIKREIRALKRFDIPYFTHHPIPFEFVTTAALQELLGVIRKAVRFQLIPRAWSP